MVLQFMEILVLEDGNSFGFEHGSVLAIAGGDSYFDVPKCYYFYNVLRQICIYLGLWISSKFYVRMSKSLMSIEYGIFL